jgi:hypothetical protein
MIRSILVLLSFHSDGSLERDPEGEMKNLPRSLLKYLRRLHPRWPVAAFSLESLRMSVEGLTAALIADRNRTAGVNHNIIPCRVCGHTSSIVADVVI